MTALMTELTATDFAKAEQARDGTCVLHADLNPHTGRFSEAPPPFAAQLLPQHFAYWDNFSIPIAVMDRPEAPLRAWRLRDVCITGKEGGVVFPNGHYLEHTLDFAPLHEPDANFERAGSGYRLKSPPPTKISDPCFLGYRAGYKNYAHWILEHSNCLYAYARNFMDAGVKLLLPDQLANSYREILDILQIPRSNIVWLGSGPVLVDDVIACDVADPELQPTIAREAFSLLRGVTDAQPVKSRALFISRADARYRPLLNRAELSEALCAIGVETFIPGQHDLAAQAAAFAGSSVIIGEHGAGLANIVFCRPGTIVFELLSEYCVHELFYRTACACDLAYGFISGTSFNDDEAHSAAHQGRNWAAAWVIDVEQVTRMVRAILSRGAPPAGI
jgi:capsular polysaccharide biosynthesis protein